MSAERIVAVALVPAWTACTLTWATVVAAHLVINGVTGR